jgi:hypothetical protein
MENTAKLLEIFADDPLGLLEVKPKGSPVRNEDERLSASFEEINAFIDSNQREPQKNMQEMQETTLYSRLKGLRENPDKMDSLRAYDRHNLLGIAQEVEVNSIEDILNGDRFGILDDAEDIFTLKHVSNEIQIPDYRANQKPCKDFEKFEYLFKECHADLVNEKRKMLPFANEQNIHEGSFFILKGVMVYVAKKGKKAKINDKVNARLRCIYENGTESDLLLRSLSRELYRNGRRITEHDEKTLDKLAGITDEDKPSGTIYILKSKSIHPEIQSIEHLYKIGFSKVDVKERIKNAENEPTYLMAPVSIVSAYECYNMNPHKLEQLLHRFFGSSCLSIDIFDHEGQRHSPREWFIAPLDIIEQTIEMVLTGDILEYRYDSVLHMIVEK